MEKDQVLDYRIGGQKKSDTGPVLFLLHGYGSHERPFSFANYLPEEYLIVSLRAH